MIQHHWIEAFILTLVHSLWQGMVLGILAAFVLMLTKKACASLRYNLINLLLLCFLFGCIATFLVELKTAQLVVVNPSENIAINSVSDLLTGLGWHIWIKNITTFLTEKSSWIAVVWLICFIYQCIRILIGFNYVDRLKIAGKVLPEPFWQQRVDMFCSQLKVNKTVKLFESALTKIPVVAGFLKPAIYVPVGMINHLPPEQIEAILLHELAHIRRNDYLAGLLQQITLAIFFFNPGLRWVISILKREREHCCDDIALVNTQDKTVLVEALLNFAKLSLNTPVHVAAFPGSGKLLLHRVRRIALNRNQSLNRWERLIFGLTIVITLLLASVSSALQRGAMPSQATGSSLASVYAVGLHAPITGNNGTNIPVTATSQPVISAVKTKRKVILPKVSPVHTKQFYPEGERYSQTAYVSQKDFYPVEIKPEDAMMMDKDLAEKNRQQAEIDRRQADKDRIQADVDRKQAEADRKQAELQRQQADRDRQQATLDLQQAEKDRAQADIDRTRAEQDRLRAQSSKPQSH